MKDGIWWEVLVCVFGAHFLFPSFSFFLLSYIIGRVYHWLETWCMHARTHAHIALHMELVQAVVLCLRVESCVPVASLALPVET